MGLTNRTVISRPGMVRRSGPESVTIVQRWRLAPLTGFLLVLLAFSAPGSATHLQPEDHNGVHLAVLVHHPAPTGGADPLGVAAGPSGNDWIREHYNHTQTPTAWIDGLDPPIGIPQGEGGGPALATAKGSREAFARRITQASPVVIQLAGTLLGGAIQVDANVQTKPEAGTTDLLLRILLVEDQVAFQGANGIALHRFVVRTAPASFPLESAPNATRTQLEFPLLPDWDRDGLGIVAYLQRNATSPMGAPAHEVVQAAAWTSHQSGPTLQSSKAALLELYTDTDCQPCAYTDAAVSELADEFGPRGPLAGSGPFRYLRPDTSLPWILAAIGGIFVAAAFRPRRPSSDTVEGPPRG